MATTALRRLRDHTLPALVATGVGVVFSSFFAIGHRDRAVSILAAGALTGLFIWIAIFILETLFDNIIDRLQRMRVVSKALLFLVGGTVGWVGGSLISSLIFDLDITGPDLLSGTGRFMLILTAGVAVGIGLAFYAFEMLERRLARTVEQLKEAEWAEKEIEMARAIQSRLLPPPFVEGNGYTISARNIPARGVAGDFYDIVRLDDGSVIVVAADVAGKGLGASLIMASVKAVLPFVAREGAENAMAMLNAKLVQELDRREFVALAYARLQPDDGAVQILNAGFPDPYLIAKDGVRALSTPGARLPLGIRSDVRYEVLTARIAPGERLLFVSDGIPEAPARGEPLGYDQLSAMLGSMNGQEHGEEWLDAFLAQVRASVDEGLADDWTAVVIERAR
jgi:serine phosphatase RsbU (regulator of sigma subunit)